MTIDDYIAECPAEVQQILQRIRKIVRKAAPEAEETISYRMPAFAMKGMLLYFAAFKNHIGIFPPVKGDAKFQKDTDSYRGPKGNFKFPLDRPMPYPLIERTVKFRLKEHLATKAGQARRKAGKTGMPNERSGAR